MAVKIQVLGRRYRSDKLKNELKKIAQQLPKKIAQEMEKQVKSQVVENISEYADLIQRFMIDEYKKEFKKNVIKLNSAEKGFDRWLAGEIEQLVEKVIKEQKWKYKWKPLNPDYKMWKIRKGLDRRIFIAYGYYLDSIKVYQSGHDWVVGVDPFRIHMKTGIRMKKLARYLEYGTSKMPARPHWRPAYEYVRKHIDRYVKKYLKEKKIV